MNSWLYICRPTVHVVWFVCHVYLTILINNNNNNNNISIHENVENFIWTPNMYLFAPVAIEISGMF